MLDPAMCCSESEFEDGAVMTNARVVKTEEEGTYDLPMAVEDFQVSRDREVGARRGQGERLVERLYAW
jgi:hypothetical protein